jgi:hypothetical protein
MTDQGNILESGFIEHIALSKAQYEEVVQFQWEYYSSLAFQRNRIYEPLKSALRGRACPFDFSKWQRSVKYRHSLDPLSARGSLADPGGRFNIGAIDATRYPQFSALYLASDKGTCLGELLGRGGAGSSLTAEELALTKPDSLTVVSVSGRLESVLDIRAEANLADFVSLISDFRLSGALVLKARRLAFPPLRLIKSASGLIAELRRPDWRVLPMRFDVPSPSQIFGRIAIDAGIEGICYSSALTDRPCLALYPQNFPNSSSYVEMDDPLPRPTVPARIDATTYANFI